MGSGASRSVAAVAASSPASESAARRQTTNNKPAPSRDKNAVGGLAGTAAGQHPASQPVPEPSGKGSPQRTRNDVPAGLQLPPKEARRLRERFQVLGEGRAQVSISQLLRIPELACNPMVPRIFEVFDQDGDRSLTLPEFLAANEYFRGLNGRKGPDEEGMQDLYTLAFQAYDTDNDGYISGEDLFRMLQRILVGLPGQVIQRMVRSTIMEFDRDSDWCINFEEFQQLMGEHDLQTKIGISF